jgi:hypothetical protein
MVRKRKPKTDAPPSAPLDEQADSDPLPYVRLDRSVKPAAALIASRLGVTFQHALGGLVEFWQLNGDPRELEALMASGKDEVILTGDVVDRRFALAMNTDTGRLAPDDLTELRLLERRPEGYRVRGMSRYFKPLQRRVQARAAAVAGGKASAKARAEKHGSAQPRSGHSSGGGSGAASVVASVVASGGASGVASKNGAQPDDSAEATPNTAVSGQRSAGNGRSSARASFQQNAYDHFQRQREARLEELSFDQVPDEQLGPATINARLKPLLDALGGERHPDVEGRFSAVVSKYLDRPQTAEATPPYPFRILATPKVWQPIVEQVLGGAT